MAASPIIEEPYGGASGRMIGGLVDYGSSDIPPTLREKIDSRGNRTLAIYPASAGFDLVDELKHLSTRAVEPNVFFNPRFLAPAMPRLEDRDVRLAVIRDDNGKRSRLRLLVPFTIEKPIVPFSAPMLRAWSSPFGPLGTPLVDRDDPAGVVEDFFAILARPHLHMPPVFVIPDVRLDGAFASMLSSLAESRGLPLEIVNRIDRPHLISDLDGDAYLQSSLSTHHMGEFRRLKRRLGEQGQLEYRIARQQEEVRLALEDFLMLEVAGWKGRRRTAMLVDRYQAAFAREATYRMGADDLCRIHALHLDGKPIASLIVFVEAGVAYTWKTAYDEAYARFSPGTLLMTEVTRTHLEDPNIQITDSCAVPDHPVVSRLWNETRPFGTIVVGMREGDGRAARRTATDLRREKSTRNLASTLRSRLRKMFGAS